MAILLSGGIGSRMHSEIPKQYIRVGGRLIVTSALKTLAEAPVIDKILIVAEQEWRGLIVEDAGNHELGTDKIMGFAAPGFNRQASIINGMEAILRQAEYGTWRKTVTGESHGGAGSERETDGTRTAEEKLADMAEEDTVFIHDAARPLLSFKEVQDCFDALAGHDGVMPVLPMKDTVYLGREGGQVSGLLDRDRIFAGQAPELFRFKKYYRANMALTPERLAAIHGSAEPAVLAGLDIVMIPGEENNFKVTTPQDLERFRSLVSGGGCR